MRAPLALATVTAVDAWLAGRPEPWAHRLRWLSKPAVVPLASRELVARRTGTLAPTTTVALAAGWAGDLALLGRGKHAFLTGLGCFAVGHVACLAGLLRHRAPARTAGPVPVTAVALGAALGPVLALAARRREPGLGMPVLTYAALLTAMTATASHLDADLPTDARRRLMAGGWMFLVSDGVLGARTFVMTEPAPWAERTVMLTYAAAQWLIAGGAARS